MNTSNLNKLTNYVNKPNTSGCAVLTGSQWIVVEYFESLGKFKILGNNEDDCNQYSMQPAESFENRLFCGICYYDEKGAEKASKSVKTFLNSSNKFYIYNPFRNIIK